MDAPKQPSPQPNQQPPDEKLKFLKREEVRTMAKDIAKAREKEAAKERERIGGLTKEGQGQKKPEVVLSQETPRRSLIPKRSLSNRKKLFIRLVVILVIVFIAVNAVFFGLWYFAKQERELKQNSQDQDTQQVTKPSPTPVIPQPTPIPEPQPQQVPAAPQTKTPVVFFEAPQQTLSLEAPEELLVRLKIFLAGSLDPGFVNIALRLKENILSLDQFFEGVSLAVPQELKAKLAENLMLFSYVTESKKRLGIVFELKETENVSELLRSWEQSIEQDTAAFFEIIGRKGSAYTPFFRSMVYRDIVVRFQTFSVIDFGIVYGIIEDRLVFTSSLESFQRTVDQLQTP